MRCALIEYDPYHEETLPTFVRLLNELDVEPDVYLVRQSRGRKPFALAPELRYRLRRVERMDARRGLSFRLRRYQLLIVNSMEPPGNLERLQGRQTSILGVMHNAELLWTEQIYRSFFAGPKRLPLVLGRHIARDRTFEGRPIHWVSHVHFGQVPADRAAGPTTFAVSGNVEFHRRNYRALLDAATELSAEGIAARIRIVGRSRSPDGRTLLAEIERRAIAGMFEVSPGEVSHPEFFRLVASSDFAVPLIDRTDERMRPYFDSKVTSSVHLAIGLGVPLVIHRDLADAYGVGPVGIAYEDGGLAGAMRAAVASDQRAREAWRAALDLVRGEILASSLANLREAIAAVGAARRR